MAVIHIISLDAVTVQAVKNKRYSEEKIVELNDRLQADTKKKKKVFLIVMTAFSIFLFVYGIFTLKRSIGFPEAIPIVLSFFPIIAIVGLAVWFLSIGYISLQWNDLIRKYYPSVYTVINGRPDAAGFSDTDKTSGTSRTSDKSDVSGQTENAEFAALEKDIEELNSIYIKANNASRARYHSLYNSIYEKLLEMESNGTIVLEPGKKGLGYLRELLINDGPEFSYTIIFWCKGNESKKYRIGVCIRGIPICKPND